MSLNSQIPSRAANVLPSDTAETFGVAIYVGGTGSVCVLTEGGNTVTFAGAPVGTIIPIRFTKVLDTGTTATNLVRFY